MENKLEFNRQEALDYLDAEQNEPGRIKNRSFIFQNCSSQLAENERLNELVTKLYLDLTESHFDFYNELNPNKMLSNQQKLFEKHQRIAKDTINEIYRIVDNEPLANSIIEKTIKVGINFCKNEKEIVTAHVDNRLIDKGYL